MMNPYLTRRICYGYTRVSTAKQDERGFSMPEQKARIEKYCTEFNCEVIEIVAEPAVSASKNKRAKRVKLTALLKKMPANCFLIVTDVTRLSRSLADFLEIVSELENKQCKLIVISQGIDTSTAQGRFNVQLMALLGQLELELTRERVETMRKYKEENQQFMGRIPYGWRSGGKDKPAIEIAEEQAVIKFVHEMASEKDRDGKRIHTDYAIAKRLNELNVKPPGKSKEWAGINIARMFKRKQSVAKNKVYEVEDLVNYVPIAEKGLPIMQPTSDESYFQNLKAFETEFFNQLVADFPDSDSE